LTHFGALGIAVAQVADENGLLNRMKMRNTTWTGLDADAASGALLFVNQNRLGSAVY
jgi:hypothetical protein